MPLRPSYQLHLPSPLTNQPFPESTGAPLWRFHFSGYCNLCTRLVREPLESHYPSCTRRLRLSTWKTIIDPTVATNPSQALYILVRDHTKFLLRTLRRGLADGDSAIDQAAQLIIRTWRKAESARGENDYDRILAEMNVKGEVFLQAIKEIIMAVLNVYGTTLPVILAVEDTFWEHSRKIDFSHDENAYLLQFLCYSPQELSQRIGFIKGRFLEMFLPLGRPRKSREVLRRKLEDLRACCGRYEYSHAPWTQELDAGLVRVAAKVRGTGERVHGFVVWCYGNGVRLRSSRDVVRRLGFLGCKEGVFGEEKLGEYGYGVGQGILKAFGRRASL